MKHECDNCSAMTENEPVCLCDECNSGCSTCSDYERRYEDLITKHGEVLKRVAELEAENQNLKQEKRDLLLDLQKSMP